MSYVPQVLQNFGAGLNLASKADALGPGEAIDALNVVFSDRGAVGQRDGFTQFNASTLTNPAESLSPFYTTGGTKQLLAGSGSRIEALATDGSIVASATSLTSGIWNFARFGSPNAETAYAGNGQNLLRKWDGSAWSSVSGSPKAGALAVTRSNRLVGSRFATTTGGPASGDSSPSHVWFSDAGLPESYTDTNYVILSPGDGEAIQAVIAWREYVFVFKESKFFVFPAEGTDSGGLPVFDYRTVDTGVGLASPQGLVATENGIYFLNRRGVFLTNGGEPEKVSDPIDPIFLGGSESYFTGGEMDQSLIGSCAMGTLGNQVYLSYSAGGSALDRTLVYDFIAGWWSLSDLPATSFANFRSADREQLYFGNSASNDIDFLGGADDDGAAITSRWRSGFADFTIPEIKRIRQTKLWGSGKCYFGISHDYTEPAGPFRLVDFTDPSATHWNVDDWNTGHWQNPSALEPRLDRFSSRGTVFSLAFSNNVLDQSWSIHRAEPHIAGSRPPSTRKVDA